MIELFIVIVLFICYLTIAYNLKEGKSYGIGFLALIFMTAIAGILLVGHIILSNSIETYLQEIKELKQKLEEQQEFEIVEEQFYRLKIK